MTSAVVFAYHNVGVRCLATLISHGIRIPLLITHEDNPNEQIWFESVAELAQNYDIPVVTASAVAMPDLVEKIRQIRPDFIFSFYFREMLPAEMIKIPRSGALNMHGSLLPKYRGRVPVNWAIIMGEKQTGATLHYMTEKPDNGPIVDQQAVPILEDDVASEVFQKVTCAAEMVLARNLQKLIAGIANAVPQNQQQASYFGGRKPEDGQINWQASAQTIHNLIRAVAPPYPGAYAKMAGHTLRILRSSIDHERAARNALPFFYCDEKYGYVDCVDGKVLRILKFAIDDRPISAKQFVSDFGDAAFPLTN